MSDKMRPVPFTHLLHQYITEYNVSGKLAGVPVYTNNAHIPIVLPFFKNFG